MDNVNSFSIWVSFSHSLSFPTQVQNFCAGDLDLVSTKGRVSLAQRPAFALENLTLAWLNKEYVCFAR
jgi:hypothetical protein